MQSLELLEKHSPSFFTDIQAKMQDQKQETTRATHEWSRAKKER